MKDGQTNIVDAFVDAQDLDLKIVTRQEALWWRSWCLDMFGYKKIFQDTVEDIVVREET